MKLLEEFGLSKDKISKFERYLKLLLQWNEKFNLTAITDVDEIVPRSGGNDHRTAFRYLAAAVHLISARTRHGKSAAALYAQKLVRITVYLRADVTAHGNTHERHLQMLARPERRPVIPVVFGEAFNIHCHGLAAHIDIAASAVIHIHTSCRKAFFCNALCFH